MKHFGIFIAFPPAVDLRSQGLGRYLAMFLKGAEALPNIRFTIVCPSWAREALAELFESERVPTHAFDILSPEGKPYALRVYEKFKAYRTRRSSRAWFARLGGFVEDVSKKYIEYFIKSAIQVHDLSSVITFLLRFIIALPMTVVILPISASLFFLRRVFLFLHSAAINIQSNWLAQKRKTVSKIFSSPQNNIWVVRLFDVMQRHEMGRMLKKIEVMNEVHAWYCPTAFWPEFQDIKKPRLLCVPDVVLSEFPVGYSQVGGDRFLGAFKDIERNIVNGDYFVTYSQHVKWSTLVDGYSIAEGNVTVIQHAPNVLNQYIDIHSSQNADTLSQNLASSFLSRALRRSTNNSYTSEYRNGDVKFLFYASQLRPNKNVITLLRAFEYLLRRRFIGYKLFLTGNPSHMPEIGDFVRDNCLENDVIFLPELSISELAACYKLAVLAVNPTLSEGGCPFTFTEALSVGTPVVMSRIGVAEEVLTDRTLREMTFFDPYNWRDCASRIEWAISNRAELLAVQRKTYVQLSKRTWVDVVKEHVCVLEKISDAAFQDEKN